MSWTVRFLRSAERDVEAAMAWYRKQEIGLDREFLDAVDETIRRVRRNPGGFAKRRRDYRAVLVRRFPYIIYYRVVGEEIRLAAVLHQRRGQKAHERPGKRKQKQGHDMHEPE